MKRWGWARAAALAVCLGLLCGCMQQIASDSTLFTTLLPEEGPAPGASQEPLQDISSLKVACNAPEGMDPYAMKSEINLKLVPLLYDSLFKLDEGFGPVPCIARDYSMQGNTCVVTLRDNICFSDGSPLTAEDVLYSAGLARAEGSYWSGSLSEIEEVRLWPGGQVAFTANGPDPYLPSLLTFPVLKKDAAGQPVGSGRYRLNAEGNRLVLNEGWYGGGIQRIKTIHLISLPDKETLIYSLKVGTINYIYSDLSDTEAAGAGGGMQYVPLNNLVYLGINRSNGLLSQPAFRRALEAAIDRESVVEGSYYRRAEPASAPFQPRWKELAGLEYERQADEETAYGFLAELGLSERDESGRLLSSSGPVGITLLVNGENSYRCEAARQVAKQLERAGIGVTVETENFEVYQSRIAAGDYDLFLAETKLKANMDLSPLLSPEGSLAYGGRDEALWEAYLQFRGGQSGLEEFLTAFYESVPFIPLAYRQGAVSFTRAIYYGVETTEQDIFYNIQDW